MLSAVRRVRRPLDQIGHYLKLNHGASYNSPSLAISLALIAQWRGNLGEGGILLQRPDLRGTSGKTLKRVVVGDGFEPSKA
jgi:hypothetical protein